MLKVFPITIVVLFIKTTKRHRVKMRPTQLRRIKGGKEKMNNSLVITSRKQELAKASLGRITRVVKPIKEIDRTPSIVIPQKVIIIHHIFRAEVAVGAVAALPKVSTAIMAALETREVV
jgi:hypothetical protein